MKLGELFVMRNSIATPSQLTNDDQSSLLATRAARKIDTGKFQQKIGADFLGSSGRAAPSPKLSALRERMFLGAVSQEAEMTMRMKPSGRTWSKNQQINS